MATTAEIAEFFKDYAVRTGSVAFALNTAKRAVKLEPESQAAWTMLSKVHFFRKEYAPAVTLSSPTTRTK